MKFVVYTAPALILIAAVVSPPTDTSDCNSAGQEYGKAVASATAALRKYEDCISASHGRSDCAAEIEALDNAHDDFADAVDEFKKACPKGERGTPE